MENEKCSKTKRFILFVVSTILATLITWHLYAHFAYKDALKYQSLSTIQLEICEFTRQLYDLELKHNPYLVKVNFQGKTDQYSSDDVAPQPLLEVDEKALALPALKTTYLLRQIFDNYELFTNVTEKVTATKGQEELDFLKAILDTAIMNKTMKFLESKEVVTNNPDSHLQLLRDLWFMPYSRESGREGSTGFEHVFLAEIRNQTVLGLHNWVYFGEQESLGNLDYKGFIEKETLEENSQYIVTFRSDFYNRTKPYNGMFVGTSPELELSLYTVCFALSLGQPCHVQLGHLKFQIIAYVKDVEGRETIGSAFPSIK